MSAVPRPPQPQPLIPQTPAHGSPPHGAPQTQPQRPVQASSIYEGVIRHRRRGAHPHAFRYRMAQLYVDLDELDHLFDGHPLWSVDRRNLAEFRRSDYLGPPDKSLSEAVRDCVQQKTGCRPAGPIRLLTHLRYAGYVFNPVSFYYCFAAGGERLECIVAEITNTPWRERHAYVLPVADAERSGGMLHWSFDKCFHVSPFIGMNRRYAWHFSEPGRHLRVHMDVLSSDAPSSRVQRVAPHSGHVNSGHVHGGHGHSGPAQSSDPHSGPVRAGEQREFDATLALERRPLDSAALRRVLWRYPLMTLKVIGAIHWQALRLWAKRNPVHPHPAGAPGGGGAPLTPDGDPA